MDKYIDSPRAHGVGTWAQKWRRGPGLEQIAGYHEALFPLREEGAIRVCMLHHVYHSGRCAAVLVFTATCMQRLTFSKSKYIFH